MFDGMSVGGMFRLLVKDQSKRMKLADVPKHPWIVQHSNPANKTANAAGMR